MAPVRTVSSGLACFRFTFVSEHVKVEMKKLQKTFLLSILSVNKLNVSDMTLSWLGYSLSSYVTVDTSYTVR